MLTQTHTHKQNENTHQKKNVHFSKVSAVFPVTGPLMVQLNCVPMCLVGVQMLHCWCTQNNLVIRARKNQNKAKSGKSVLLTLEVPNSGAVPQVCVCIDL